MRIATKALVAAAFAGCVIGAGVYLASFTGGEEKAEPSPSLAVPRPDGPDARRTAGQYDRVLEIAAASLARFRSASPEGPQPQPADSARAIRSALEKVRNAPGELPHAQTPRLAFVSPQVEGRNASLIVEAPTIKLKVDPASLKEIE